MKNKITLLLLLTVGFAVKAQVGINTTNPQASLDVQASDQASPSLDDGLLIPRIDAFPATDPGADQNSMMVYLTTTDGANDPGFYYWDNGTGSWGELGTGGSGGGTTDAWSLSGNTGTNSTTDFLGTTDNQAITFRTNNIQRIRFSSERSRISFWNNGNSIFIGDGAGDADDLSNNNNTFFGKLAGNETTGEKNVAFGYSSLVSNTLGSRNIAIGNLAMQNKATGDDNIAIGFQTMSNAQGGNNRNIVIGNQSGFLLGITAPSSDMLMIDNNGAVSLNTPLIGGNFSTNRVGINVDLATSAAALTHTLTVGGDFYASGDVETDGDFVASGTPLTVPDYVFESFYNGYSDILPEYDFTTLEEAEAFVKANGHLPGVKSYKEIKENGYTLKLVESYLANLEKIEESFLYITQLNKKIKDQQKELLEKDEKIEDLEKRLERLEKLILEE